MTEISRIIPAYAGSTPHAPNRPVKASDHPRIRGEHQMNPRTKTSMAGSSPHTRGAHTRFSNSAPSWRIIPAYAGSTRALARWSSRRRDHPRIRGEHGVFVELETPDVGSSPHTRGAPDEFRLGRMEGGIIPAIRGEHAQRETLRLTLEGSSPHTRGAPDPPQQHRRHPRIIPAYAGSTASARRRGRTVGDHPRIRGEHPRGEGRRNEGGRIIPAYAGSTASFPRQAPRPPDHPRIRGEHRPSSPGSSWTAGSSPHTRGAPDRGEARQSGDGIIPAYAGSTASSSPPCPPPSDHPRIRGEHTRVPETETRSPGSSPHTRGARADEPRHRRRIGIIPAYAGST